MGLNTSPLNIQRLVHVDARIEKRRREVANRAAIQPAARRIHRGHRAPKVAHGLVAQIADIAGVAQRRVYAVEGAQNLQPQPDGTRQAQRGTVTPGLLVDREAVAAHRWTNQRRFWVQLTRVYRVGENFGVHALILHKQLLREPRTHVRSGHWVYGRSQIAAPLVFTRGVYGVEGVQEVAGERDLATACRAQCGDRGRLDAKIGRVDMQDLVLGTRQNHARVLAHCLLVDGKVERHARWVAQVAGHIGRESRARACVVD